MTPLWHIVTGEYPPQAGGVSDYTRLVARGLAEAGEEVHVWAPACAEQTPVDEGVEVHRLPDHFGPRSLAVLNAQLNKFSAPSRILVQYVPQAFGWRGLNLPFCFWLRTRRRDAVWVMFHEVRFPLGWKQPPAYNFIGVVTRLMASLVTSAAERKFVSIPAWAQMISSRDSERASTVWLPVPSNVPVTISPPATAEIRSRLLPKGGFLIGHFGTYGGKSAEYLMSILPRLLAGHSDRKALLLGRRSEGMREEILRRHPELSEQIFAAGALPADELSVNLSACDVMIQPFIDGVSSRRGSAMACLAHGLPVVTTKGPLTESIWAESEAVALSDAADVDGLVLTAERLLTDSSERERLGTAAGALYKERFDISHTISSLREPVSANGK